MNTFSGPKNILWPKKCASKTILCQKIWGNKEFKVQKKFWVKKIVSLKILDKTKNLVAIKKKGPVQT